VGAVPAPLASVLAHQGGWDEILFVLAPLGLFAWLLMLARRRAERMGLDGDAADQDGSGSAAAAPRAEGDESTRTP
jgi:predicted MFS family arabinose efflux permease